MNFFLKIKYIFVTITRLSYYTLNRPGLRIVTSIFQLKHGLSLKLSLRVVSSLKPTPL